MKGSLASKQRPAEWGKWITKTSKGVQPYSSTPVIGDPLEFGIAIVKWWHSIQLFVVEMLSLPSQSMMYMSWVMYGLDCGRGVQLVLSLC